MRIVWRDIVIGLVIGVVIGALLLPILSNTNLIAKIPSPYLAFLILLPILSAAGVFVASLIGRMVPIIWQIAKFGLIGVLNTALDLGVYNVLIYATGYDKGLQLALINAVSFTVAVVNSYIWNKKWVFEGKARRSRTQFFEFLTVSVVAAIISSLIVGLFTGYIAPPGGVSAAQWANVAKIMAIAFSFVWNFVGYKFVVFREKM
ncbi:MAG: GtrA family protein [Candidatus Sungbacteria bacterium]|uniref:GtrA family protein n=1 Tax=Candidatus Sungiibacteriota bacterium TaxID=2750080 RepID=A0A9D6LUG9_9BACT|nr:GtrA family protein [Candidatus Sungbacteria bacterium]